MVDHPGLMDELLSGFFVQTHGFHHLCLSLYARTSGLLVIRE
jgi:hypothetical protein